jgi:drug/metabolite transporter (DMT)-like permease
MVPALGALFLSAEISPTIWWSAALALVGIVLVQAKKGQGSRAQITASIAFAILAALCMSVFDLLLQQWAQAWGSGTFLPVSFTFAGLFAIPLIPWTDSPKRIRELKMTKVLLIGCLLMAVQSIGMTFTLAQFGDATRVNIVYSLRGLWGVLLTWLLAEQFGATAGMDNRVMKMRLAGAVLLTIAVVVAVSAGE